MSFGLSKWKCHACREVIKCDFIKLQFYWLLALLPCGFLFGVLDGYFDLGLFNIVFLLPFFDFVSLTLYYVKFERRV